MPQSVENFIKQTVMHWARGEVDFKQNVAMCPVW